MFKLIFTILLTVSITYGIQIDRKNSCLTVSSTQTNQCSKKPEFLNTNINFGQLQPNNNNNIYEMPIYINTNTNEKIEMSMKPIKIRGGKNRRQNRVINAKFTSLLTGKTTIFRKGHKVELLPRNYYRFRDGNTLVGYITFIIPSISEFESAGKFRAKVKVKVDNQFRTGKGKIKIKYSIKPILVVGLFDVSSFVGNKVFKYARVDFGMLDNEDTTTKELDVYVKSNYQNMSVYMRFNKTPPLKHKRANETIAVQYYYKKRNRFRYQEIMQGSEVLLLSYFKNDGTKPVGTLKFIAANARGKLSGNYGASIRVTISAQ